MKRDTWLIVVVLLLLIGLAGMMRMNTILGEKQARLVAAQIETDRLSAEIYWARIKHKPLPYRHPLDQGWISSETGYRTDPMGGTEERLHRGIDLAAARGTPVYAALSGRVMEHFLPPDGGKWKGHSILGGMITIEHEDGLFRYGHLSKTEVHEGKWVEMGDKIGEVGSTGISTGPHLHWESVVDPIKYLEGL